VEEPAGRNPYVLSREELENVRVRRFEELLVARFPSVRVSRRGGEYVIRIRGAGNLTGGGDPLFIVDGMPTPVSSLANLNPADIFRIEVVPDHRTAFYGIRGAFGVIIVTTIRP
jgi:outer membrane receptor protein involved in Fe transport